MTSLFCTREYDDVIKEAKKQRDTSEEGKKKVNKMFADKYKELMKVL